MINNCLFSNNLIKTQIIDVFSVLNQTINNSICHMNNLGFPYQYLGGFFRSSNVLIRVYNNVTVTYCYSDFTTIGLKIIDNAIYIENMKYNLNFCNSPMVL